MQCVPRREQFCLLPLRDALGLPGQSTGWKSRAGTLPHNKQEGLDACMAPTKRINFCHLPRLLHTETQLQEHPWLQVKYSLVGNNVCNVQETTAAGLTQKSVTTEL